MTRRRLVLLAMAAGLVAACASSSSTVPLARQTNADVSFNDCSKVKCAASLDGAAYQILLPKKWNGSLLLYSHGYRQAQPAPPDFAEPSTAAEPAPGYSEGDKKVSDALLAAGYALAGSAYASNGWAVADGVKADEELYSFFVKNVGSPYRVLVWGDSLGGLVTEVLAEKHPEWVNGVAPMCGVLGGPVANLNLALDVSYAMKTFFNPSLKLTGYASWAEAVQNWTTTATLLQKELTDPATQADAAARLMMVGALVDAPTQTSTSNGATLQSQIQATAESVLTALGYSTFGRYDIEQRYGGNPSGNADTDYAGRLTDSERSLIDTLGGTAYSAKLSAQLAAGTRITADPAAVAKFAASGTPTGAVVEPTITMHTTADPLVLAQNETLFRQRYATNPKVTADLVQVFIAPPKDPAAWAPRAPYGAGHCNFTARSYTAIAGLLNNWVQNGVYPGTSAIEAVMGDSSGYSPAGFSAPWPDPAVK